MSGKLIAAALFLAAQGANAPEILNNDNVIALVKAGLGSETVVAKINNSPTSFDTSTDTLIRLKQAGVPDAVIAAMLNKSKSVVSQTAGAASNSADPLNPHASGIYLLDDSVAQAKMVRIDPTVSNQTKTSGMLGFAFSYGLAKVKMKTVVPNPSARVRIAAVRPSFYFYFDQASANMSNFGLAGAFGLAMTSPNEFSLIRFDTKKDHREAAVGQFNITGAKTGVMDKARIAFTYSDVAPGVFKVTPTEDLPPGEYGFIHSIAGGTGMGTVSRIFDFGIERASGPSVPAVSAPTSTSASK